MSPTDSRLGRARKVRRLGRNLGAMQHGEPVFCLSCGELGGYVTLELPPGVLYLCGACEGTYGIPSEMKARPDLDAAMEH